MRFQSAFILLFLVFALSLWGCKKSERAEKGSFKVDLVLGKGGIDDKSFNASAYKGAKEAEKEFKLDLREVEVIDDAQVEPTLKNFAQKGYGLIVAVGYEQKEALEKAAKAFPDRHFALVDAAV